MADNYSNEPPTNSRARTCPKHHCIACGDRIACPHDCDGERGQLCGECRIPAHLSTEI